MSVSQVKESKLLYGLLFVIIVVITVNTIRISQQGRLAELRDTAWQTRWNTQAESSTRFSDGIQKEVTEIKAQVYKNMAELKKAHDEREALRSAIRLLGRRQ